jgi:hypothetical protein
MSCRHFAAPRPPPPLSHEAVRGAPVLSLVSLFSSCIHCTGLPCGPLLCSCSVPYFVVRAWHSVAYLALFVNFLLPRVRHHPPGALRRKHACLYVSSPLLHSKACRLRPSFCACDTPLQDSRKVACMNSMPALIPGHVAERLPASLKGEHTLPHRGCAACAAPAPKRIAGRAPGPLHHDCRSNLQSCFFMFLEKGLRAGCGQGEPGAAAAGRADVRTGVSPPPPCLAVLECGASFETALWTRCVRAGWGNPYVLAAWYVRPPYMCHSCPPRGGGNGRLAAAHTHTLSRRLATARPMRGVWHKACKAHSWSIPARNGAPTVCADALRTAPPALVFARGQPFAQHPTRRAPRPAPPPSTVPHAGCSAAVRRAGKSAHGVCPGSELRPWGGHAAARVRRGTRGAGPTP